MKTKQLLMNWKEVEFLDCLEKEASSNKLKLQGKEFLIEGKYPIVDQGEDFIAGYTNDKSKIYSEKLPVIIFGDHTRIFKFVNFPFALGADGVKILVPKKNLDAKYLYYVLRNLYLPSAGYSRHYKFLKSKKIPLPPLQTQKKIVAILEKAEKLKQRREQADKLTDEYLKSVFNEMFLEEKFEKVELGQVAEIISGSTPSTIIKEYWNGKINWVTPAELIDGPNYYYYETKKKITEEGLKSCSSNLFPKGTVILTTRAPIGKVAIAGIEMCSNQGFKNFITSEKINSVYLYFWFLLKKDYLNSLGHGATFKEISKKIVSQIKIPLPPLPLQKKFASIVEKVEKMKEKQKQSSEEINNLFNALMQKGFKGELGK